MHNQRIVLLILGATLASLLYLQGVARSQPDPAPAALNDVPTSGEAATPDTESSGGGLFELLRAGSVIGLLIILLSIAAVALVIEHIMTIRATVLMPPDLADQTRSLVSAGQLDRAVEGCEATPSFLGRVLQAGLGEADAGWAAVEKGMEDATAEQAARLFRKIEYLALIGNIAPMMGLLGTVTGMIGAFRKVAETQGAARAADLAGGIYLALVTTVLGLIVAIPALAAFAIFRNRVDELVAEVAHAAAHALHPLKRTRTSPPRVVRPARRGKTDPPAEGGS